MSRLVPYAGSYEPQRPGVAADGSAAPVSASPRERLEAIAKFVPAEVLAFYLPGVNVVQMFPAEQQTWLHRGLFALAWLGVLAYFRWIAAGDARGPRQIVVSVLAFPIWVYATNRDVGVFGAIYKEPTALLLLLVFTFVCSFLVPQKPA
jgi:hypothetical protein